MITFIKNSVLYLRTIFEESPGVLSSMRVIYVYGSFVMINCVAYGFVLEARKSHGFPVISQSTGWLIVALIGTLAGGKTCQSIFAEK